MWRHTKAFTKDHMPAQVVRGADLKWGQDEKRPQSETSNLKLLVTYRPQWEVTSRQTYKVRPVAMANYL